MYRTSTLSPLRLALGPRPVAVARACSWRKPSIFLSPVRSLKTTTGETTKWSSWWILQRRWVRFVLLSMAGIIGVKRLSEWRREWKLKKLESVESSLGNRRRKLVILGSGWGAVSVLQHLEPGAYDVHIVSPRNYFLFSPLLPSVTVGTVEARSLVVPIRKLMGRRHGKLANFYEAECTNVDPVRKVVHCKDTSSVVGELSEFELTYDVLVVAVGAETNTMKVGGVKEYAHFLKEMDDAKRIRATIIDNVETAYLPGQSEDERHRLLHFVVVGGGPTGVGFAAELRDFLKDDLVRLYPNVQHDMKITVVQSRSHILNTYESEISEYTEEHFRQGHSIDILSQCRVAALGKTHLTVIDKATKNAKNIPYGLCVWSAGIAAQPLIQKLLHVFPGQNNRHALITDCHLRVKNAEGVFAIGDCATEDQAVLSRQAEALFKEADVNGDGSLTIDEFKALMDKAQRLYPHVSIFFAKAKESISSSGDDFSHEGVFRVADKNKDNTLDFEEFCELLRQVDGTLTSYPATAQVAAQQGCYLANLLNRTQQESAASSSAAIAALKPFHYKHMGSFAYVGDNRAVLQVPILGTMKGWWTMWLWRAFYASELATTRTRTLVIFDWLKSYVFGRDTSRF